MAGEFSWGEIAAFVGEVHAREGAKGNPSLYRMLGRQALGEISAAAEPIEGVWTNGPGGVSLVGNSVELPAECLRVSRVDWDGSELPFKSKEELDRTSPDWWIAAGARPSCYTRVGSMLMLDLAPSGYTSGMLTIRGPKSLPDFSDDPDDPNPLSYLPAHLQLLPAYYILANLPVDVQEPNQMARQAKYQAMWESRFSGIADAVRERRLGRFRY